MIFGGKLESIPKPWRFELYPLGEGVRRIKIYSNVWDIQRMGNGHQHVDITEEDNLVWDTNENDWRNPTWTDHESPYFQEYFDLIKGRTDMNTGFIRKKDVVKWVVKVLIEWGVIGNKHYKIEWDLDDDDPLADVILAREMRKRAERSD